MGGDTADAAAEVAAAARKFPKRKVNSDPTVPNSFKQAQRSSDWEHWKKGMDQEFFGLRDTHECWKTVSMDEAKEAGSTVLGNRWVYRKKVLVDGSMQWKARLVVKGFMQAAGVDHGDVFLLWLNLSHLDLL